MARHNYLIGHNTSPDRNKPNPSPNRPHAAEPTRKALVTRESTITLVRYNGPHGEINRHSDGHYNKPHIHRITAAEIASGSTEPQESHREITTRYGTFEQALLVFFDDIAAPDSGQYFSELLQGRLFNGH